MTTIDPSYYLASQPKSREPSTNLGKDEFMKILMTQLQNQDPLNPMEDKEFISQMATFSSLEQMMQMSKSIDTLVKNQTVSPVIQYSHLIGKEVEHYRIDKETGEIAVPKEVVTGQVQAISQQEGYAVLELANDVKIYTDEVLRIKQESPTE
ncbi:flagellar basal-body rod modification protein FlgD [Gracilibacillus boraciitolerans JCM 21714]|uniref:Flagellar basal-body rod modification protein FlgD n=1 Tax=Gracilibacillus boraciitolerans JCM 21714 TaxID=1298598 RepID=W4VEN1_9BACI|nr:flagellar hook assembly protein FlgD [Gracilibacillus boraciitolerans]GAE91626.1 flagellar basal-body rod modification protein FlgD [Gracilibacillus boraciitolerans JCM 21714]